MLHLLEFLGQAQAWVQDLVLVLGLLWGLVLALQELGQE
jgi:hypothetical protein